MTTATDHWLANILMSPPPRPTAFELSPGTYQSQVAEPIPYLSPEQEQPPHIRRLADALVRGQSQQGLSQPVDEAQAAQQAREAFTRRTRQSVQPEGGRKEGALTEFVRDAMIPQSPLDVAFYALGGPFRPAVKAGMLGLGAALESSPAQAGIGKLVRGVGGLADRLVARFPQYANRYPEVGDPIRKIDPVTGKEYWARELTPEAKEFARAHALIDGDMRRNGYEPYFDPEKRFHVDSSFYPTNVDTRDIVPRRQATFDRYMDIIGSQDARERLRLAHQRGLAISNARDMLALGQLEQEYLKKYGPKIGREAFPDWVGSVAATTGGADPTSNLLMAGFANFARARGLPYTEGSYKLPAPVYGRFLMPNMRKHEEIFDAGGWTALGAQNPKRHDFAQAMLGNPRVGIIDEQIASGMVPGVTVPPHRTYGVFQRVLQQEAERAGVLAGPYSDRVRAGFIDLKNPGHRMLQPMISDFNDSIERIHRLMGMSHDQIVDGLVSNKIPLFGIGGLGILPDFGARSETGIGGGRGSL